MTRLAARRLYHTYQQQLPVVASPGGGQRRLSCVSCLSRRRLTEPAPRGVQTARVGPLRRCAAAPRPRTRRPDALNHSPERPVRTRLNADFRLGSLYFSQLHRFLGALPCGGDTGSVPDAADGHPDRRRRVRASPSPSFAAFGMEFVFCYL